VRRCNKRNWVQITLTWDDQERQRQKKKIAQPQRESWEKRKIEV
jgi:hypothetical protein